ncbi:hypothetical protein RJ55_07077 [Drechmeria coniospora]|nr:hypothetical protein RJ55_07077 [Drechmeria coniospora]
MRPTPGGGVGPVERQRGHGPEIPRGHGGHGGGRALEGGAVFQPAPTTSPRSSDVTYGTCCNAGRPRALGAVVRRRQTTLARVELRLDHESLARAGSGTHGELQARNKYKVAGSQAGKRRTLLGRPLPSTLSRRRPHAHPLPYTVTAADSSKDRRRPPPHAMDGNKDFKMRLLLGLFAATALARPGSDTLQKLDMQTCPSFTTAAQLEKLRDAFQAQQFKRFRQCVPSHGNYQPFQGIASWSNWGFLAHSTSREPGCIPTVAEYGCIHGFTCHFEQNCVRRLECGRNDEIMDCHIRPCYEHTKEMQCTMKKPTPAGMEGEVDHLQFHITLGDKDTFGSISVEVTVDGTVYRIPFFEPLHKHGSSVLTVDMREVFKKKSIKLSAIESFRLVSDGQVQLTYAANAVCNLGLEIQSLRVRVRDVASGLFFQALPIAADPKTGQSNFKTVNACKEKGVEIFKTYLASLTFTSRIGTFTESTQMKRCFDTWPNAPECEKSQALGETAWTKPNRHQ